MSRTRPPRLRAGILALTACLHAMAAVADDEPRLEFLRVHVPAARLRDVPLGPGRYVPMAVADFDAAVARLAAPADAPSRPEELLPEARYSLVVGDDGSLTGTVSFDIDATQAAGIRDVPLGRIAAGRAEVTTGRGTGEAVLFGTADGGVAVRTAEEGTYRCTVSCPRIVPDAPVSTLPLVAALATSVSLRIDPALRPVVVGSHAPAPQIAPDETVGPGAWLIHLGPERQMNLRLVPRDAPEPRLGVWTETVVRGRQAEVAALVQPYGTWSGRECMLLKDPEVRTVAVETADARPIPDWQEANGRRSLTVRLPRSVEGSTEAFVVRAVATIGRTEGWRVPALHPRPGQWGGGGLALVCDPTQAVVALDASQSRVVAADVAARWPLPSRMPTPRPAPRDAGRHEDAFSSLLHFEEQAHDAAVTVTLRPRVPQVEVARVSTVELSPGQVTGRADCAVRVLAGEAFSITGRIAPGWTIDSVEIRDVPAATERTGEPSPAEQQPEWRQSKAADGQALMRIGLPFAARSGRDVVLRITAHHAGIPFGRPFRTSEMDIVRLDGEKAESTLIDLQVGTEALVEIAGTRPPTPQVEGRLADLVDPVPPRARLPGGLAADREARLIEERPPLDADVEARISLREDRLAESFTFRCRPESNVVDSFTVRFSEPMGESLAWSLVEPTQGAVTARRLDPERVDSARGRRHELWQVELNPAVRGTVVVRADRETPFGGPAPLPLAWVEEAVASRGTLVVTDPRASGLQVVNRGLVEMPPAPDESPDAGDDAMQFAFGPPAEDVGRPQGEIVPAASTEARAWAWLQETRCWCHDDGRIECEDRFDVENQGRSVATMLVLPGSRLEAIEIDGVGAAAETPVAAGGGISINLPSGHRRVQVRARTSCRRNAEFGAWWVEPGGVTIDVPVLGREIRIGMPSALAAVSVPGGLAAATFAAQDSDDWLRRLFGFGWSRGRGPTSTANASLRPARAFRFPEGGVERQFVPSSRGGASRGVLVIRRRLVSAMALVAALCCGLLAMSAARRSATIPILVGGLAAIAALWLPDPLDGVARAAWWGVLAAGLVALRRAAARIGTSAVLAVVTCGAAPSIAAESPAPLRVFVTADSGAEATALVPESLFRVLAREPLPAGTAAIRVIACRITVPPAGDAGPWTVALDIDADAGGTLMLDQSPVGAGWEAPADRRAGTASTTLLRGGAAALVRAGGPGRQRVELGLLPARDRDEDVEIATVCMPPAATATLEFVDAAGEPVRPAAGGVTCERWTENGAWLPLQASAPAAARDVSGATRLRVVRPLGPFDLMAGGMRAAESFNDVDWSPEACRITARFAIDAGRQVARSFIVRASPRLESWTATPRTDRSPDVAPLGEGRFLVSLPRPERGSVDVTVGFRMPLASPVGTFSAPAVWLESAGVEVRTWRVRGAPDLEVSVEPPAGAIPLLALDAEGHEVAPGWRLEPPHATREATGTLQVRRRRRQVAGEQSLAIEFGDDSTTLHLRARLDAVNLPLQVVPVELPAGCVVDRVALFDEMREAEGDAAVDVQWSRRQDDLLMAVVQRPREGRFRLEFDGRILGRPARSGSLPVARAAIADGPLAVRWRWEGESAGLGTGTADVLPGDLPPAYERVEAAPSEPGASPPRTVGADAPATAASRADAVDRTEVVVAIDEQGRMRGVARLEVFTDDEALELNLPPDTRLFDVLVDGRRAHAVPRADDTWLVPLHRVAWPRSILLLFEGDLGPAVTTGGHARLIPPRLVGVGGDSPVLWEVRIPAGTMMRPHAPATLLDEAAWTEALEAARPLLETDFARAVAASQGVVRERLEEFAAARLAGPTVREQAWTGAILGSARSADAARVVRLAGDEDGTLRFVLAREPVAGGRPRATATAVLAATCAFAVLIGRLVRSRHPTAAGPTDP